MTHKVTKCHVSFTICSSQIGHYVKKNNLLEANVSNIESMTCSCKHLAISFALNTLKQRILFE